VIFGVAKWFVVGVLAGVALFLAALAFLLLGLTLPFAALFGWLAVRLARQPDQLTGASRWAIRGVSVMAGLATMAVFLGSA
jgi:hypothetical protein